MTSIGTDRAAVMMRVPIPTGTNALLFGLCVACHVLAYFMLPLLLLPMGDVWLLSLLPYVFMTPVHSSVMHEAVHWRLHPSNGINEAAGRLACVLFGATLQTLRFGHLLHHSRNGTPSDRPEYYDSSRSSRGAATLRYYAHLFFGPYAIELAGLLLVLLPRPLLRQYLLGLACAADDPDRDLGKRLLRFLDDRRRLRGARIDSIASLMLIAVAGYCYGADWMYLASALVVRGMIVSYLDNSYHYGAPLASDKAAYNLSLPRPVQSALLNFNLHRVHHRYPALPWSALPAAFIRDGDDFDAGFATAMLHQLRGPIPSSRYFPELSPASTDLERHGDFHSHEPIQVDALQLPRLSTALCCMIGFVLLASACTTTETTFPALDTSKTLQADTFIVRADYSGKFNAPRVVRGAGEGAGAGMASYVAGSAAGVSSPGTLVVAMLLLPVGVPVSAAVGAGMAHSPDEVDAAAVAFNRVGVDADLVASLDRKLVKALGEMPANRWVCIQAGSDMPRVQCPQAALTARLVLSPTINLRAAGAFNPSIEIFAAVVATASVERTTSDDAPDVVAEAKWAFRGDLGDYFTLAKDDAALLRSKLGEILDQFARQIAEDMYLAPHSQIVRKKSVLGGQSVAEFPKDAVIRVEQDFSLGGYSGRDAAFDVPYQSTGNATPVSGASEATVSIVGSDGRTTFRDRVGTLKAFLLGYTMGVFVATNDIPYTVGTAIEHELRTQGFQIGPGHATISVEVLSFYDDFPVKGFGWSVIADVKLNVTVRDSASSIVFTKTYDGDANDSSSADVPALITNARTALIRAFQNAVNGVVTDTSLRAAIFSAQQPKTPVG